jgi:hypothetical protein
MQFTLQRYSHLEETHLAKIAITDIRWTPHHAVEIPWQVGILKSAKKTQKQKFWHRRRIWYDCDHQTKIADLRLLWGKSDNKLNATVKYNFLRFLTVICTPRYDKRFRNYVILKSGGLLEFCSEQLCSMRNLDFWPQNKWDLRKLSIISLHITFLAFRRLPKCFNLTNDSEVMIVQSYRYYWKFLFELKKVTYWLQNLGLEEMRPKETLNIKALGDSINSLKWVEMHDIDIGWRNYEVVELVGFSRHDYELESIFKFLLAFKGLLLDAIWMYDVIQHVGPIRPH